MKPITTICLLVFSCFSGFSQMLIHDTGGKLSQRWQIKDDSTKLFKIVPYKPVYFYWPITVRISIIALLAIIH